MARKETNRHVASTKCVTSVLLYNSFCRPTIACYKISLLQMYASNLRRAPPPSVTISNKKMQGDQHLPFYRGNNLRSISRGWPASFCFVLFVVCFSVCLHSFAELPASLPSCSPFAPFPSSSGVGNLSALSLPVSRPSCFPLDFPLTVHPLSFPLGFFLFNIGFPFVSPWFSLWTGFPSP